MQTTTKHQTISFKSLFKVLVIILSVIVLTFSLTNLSDVYARSLQDVQNEIDRKKLEKEAAAARAGALGQEAQGVEGEVNVLVEQIASIQSQINSNIARQNELNAQITEAEAKLTEQRDQLSANIRSVYIEGELSPLEMIASSNNLSDFVDKQEYRDRIKSNISRIVDEIEGLKIKLNDQKTEVTKILADQQTLKSGLDEKNSIASSKLASINRTKSSFDSQVAAAQGDITSLQREVAAMQAALSRVNVANLPSSGSVSRGTVIGTVGNTGNSFGSHLHLRAQVNGRAVDPFNYLGGRWSAPLNGPITQYFGENPWRYGYGANGHDGIDYGVPSGTPIKAVEDGVLYKGWSQQLVGFWHFGCMAMVRHDDGLLSIYAHMQASNC